MTAELTDRFMLEDLPPVATPEDAPRDLFDAIADELDREDAPAEDVTTTPEEPAPTPTPQPAATETVEAPAEDEQIHGPLDALLRDRPGLLARIERGEDLTEIARVMLVTAVCGAAAFGAALGVYRGGGQILYAAIKMPLVILATTAVCAPLYTALKAALRQRASLVEDFALLLSALALACVVTASLIPVLLLAIFQQVDYHQLVLLVVALCGVGGASGFMLFLGGLQRQVERGGRFVYLTFLVVLGLVSMQLSWVMRPYLVRPQSDEVPFVRQVEGSFFEAVRRSVDSARGVYRVSADAYTSSPRAQRVRRVIERELPAPTRASDTRAGDVLTGEVR